MLCHLSAYANKLDEGSDVFPGMEVAKVGTSGGASGSYSETSFAGSDHLHLSVIRCDEANIDIDSYLNKETKISIKDGKNEKTEEHRDWKSISYIDPFNYAFEGGWMKNKSNDSSETERSKLEENYRKSLKEKN